MKGTVFAVLITGLVVVSAAVSASGVTIRDAVGDVKGGPGPDITAVTAFERAGPMRFRILFAKAPPLAHNARFTDLVLISISTTGKSKVNYVLGVHAVDLNRVILRRLPNGKLIDSGSAVVSGRSVTLSLEPRRIGNPRAIRFMVAAGREMIEGQGGGGDYAPNRGTMLWTR